jgi:protein-S-isoprenylcysteine O-methyltransferase Ste14
VSLVAIGVLLAAWGITTFRIARTSVIPHHSASRLVTAGPYRFTRNPMYTGLLISYVGATALFQTLWPLVLLPFVIFVMIRFVIQREERYLSDAFDADYFAYRGRVRRWL